MDPRTMMGYESPGDKRIPVPVRDWDALKRAAWRSQFALEITMREALIIIEHCRHQDGCPGKEIETEPCFSPTFDGDGNRLTDGCPDREMRMSALVILNAARQLSPIDARKPGDGTFYAPTREYFSEVLATLAAAQVENDMLRAALREAGVEPPSPNPQLEEKNP